jgi:outer membrane protein OmpA-like peptidoglycan-associated protein
LRNLTPEVREKPNVDLVINFEFNSAKLLTESKPLLDNLAKAIKSDQLRNLSFVVEGHTDIKGTPAYNLKLSDQRASSVVQYLTNQGVEKNRLKAIGKGSSELLIPDQPEAAENRRVKISLGS